MKTQYIENLWPKKGKKKKQLLKTFTSGPQQHTWNPHEKFTILFLFSF